MRINYRSHKRWSDWDTETLKLLSEYEVPQRVIGYIVGRSRKSVERKKYHLKKSKFMEKL